MKFRGGSRRQGQREGRAMSLIDLHSLLPDKRSFPFFFFRRFLRPVCGVAARGLGAPRKARIACVCVRVRGFSLVKS